jgi:hypothetical protein
LCIYPPLYSYNDEHVTILHTGDDRKVGQLFYTTVQSLTMSQLSPKHVGVCILKHYRNSKGVCAFVGNTVTTDS